MNRPDRASLAVLIIALAAFALFGGLAWLRLSSPAEGVARSRLLTQGWGVILFVLSLQAIGAFVLFKRPSDPAARALFLGTCGRLASAVWIFALPEHDLANGIGLMAYQIATFSGWMLMWSAGLHFALLFPRANPILERHRWIIPVVTLRPIPFTPRTALCCSLAQRAS
jgi:membrane-bound acyltransferase YfiQ involved in biofilm formation